jgi:hypothetical protein
MSMDGSGNSQLLQTAPDFPLNVCQRVNLMMWKDLYLDALIALHALDSLSS